MARKIKEEYEKEGLCINTEKTKYLCIDNTEINLKIRKNEVIKTCKYKYLGAEITKDGKDSEEIKQRIGLERRAVRRLEWNVVTEGNNKRTEKTYATPLLKAICYTGRKQEGSQR